jgi:hypothetical protein
MPSLIADPHTLRHLEFCGLAHDQIAPIHEIYDPLMPRAIGIMALPKCLDSQLRHCPFENEPNIKKTAFAVSCPIRDWQEFCGRSLKA